MTASWVIRERESKQVVAETFNEATAMAINREKYEAVPIQKHLGEINAAGRRNRVMRGEDAGANRIMDVLAKEGWRKDSVLAFVMEKNYSPYMADLRISYDSIGRQYWLKGSFFSEGRNVLESEGICVNEGASDEEIRKVVCAGLEKVDMAINQSFAVKHLANAPAPAI